MRAHANKLGKSNNNKTNCISFVFEFEYILKLDYFTIIKFFDKKNTHNFGKTSMNSKIKLFNC